MLVEDVEFWLIVHVCLLFFLQQTLISDILYTSEFAVNFQ